jgi:glutathione S-transferase
MKLYGDPISTTCRPVMLFAEQSGIDIELHLIDLFKGAHMQPEFAAINPSRAVPVLEDDGFLLHESSAILKYLADKVNSPAYPKDLKKRAKINALMDWFNTGMYRDFGYNFVYPQIFPSQKLEDPAAQKAKLDFGRANAKKWLDILDQHLIGPDQKFLLGDEVTIADYFGASILTIADLVHCDLSPWRNVKRWLNNMAALPYWEKVNADYQKKLVEPMKETPFVMF